MMPREIKARKFAENNSNATIELLMEKFRLPRSKAYAVLHPDYYIKIRAKYEIRIERKIKQGLEMLD